MLETSEAPELLTVDAAARTLSVSRQTIYRRVQDGQLEAFRVGETGQLRIRREAIDALLTPLAREPAP